MYRRYLDIHMSDIYIEYWNVRVIRGSHAEGGEYWSRLPHVQFADAALH